MEEEDGGGGERRKERRSGVGTWVGRSRRKEGRREERERLSPRSVMRYHTDRSRSEM